MRNSMPRTSQPCSLWNQRKMINILRIYQGFLLSFSGILIWKFKEQPTRNGYEQQKESKRVVVAAYRCTRGENVSAKNRFDINSHIYTSFDF